MLLYLYPRVQGFWRIVGQNRHGGLDENWATVNFAEQLSEPYSQ
jgi:hypothetical protein